MDLTKIEVTWRGVTFSSDPAAADWIDSLEGWEDRESRREVVPRAGAHGTMGSAPLATGRTVRMSGLWRDPGERDRKLAEYSALFALTDDVDAPAEDLTITLAGRTLSAPVWVTRYATELDLWGPGYFRWRVEFQSDDWLRYGSPVSAHALFPQRTAGLVWPLFPDGVLDFGSPSASNRLVLSNAGNAAAAVQHEVTGPVDAAGFEIVDVGTGRRLVFEGAVAAGSRVLLDGVTGQVLADGLYDRGDVLTRRDWVRVPPGGSVQFAFVPRGSRTAAVLTSTIRPTYW